MKSVMNQVVSGLYKALAAISLGAVVYVAGIEFKDLSQQYRYNEEFRNSQYGQVLLNLERLPGSVVTTNNGARIVTIEGTLQDAGSAKPYTITACDSKPVGRVSKLDALTILLSDGTPVSYSANRVAPQYYHSGFTDDAQPIDSNPRIQKDVRNKVNLANRVIAEVHTQIKSL